MLAPGAAAAADFDDAVVYFSLAVPLCAPALKAITNRPNAPNQVFRFIVATGEF
jgi:hypothetical protein